MGRKPEADPRLDRLKPWTPADDPRDFVWASTSPGAPGDLLTWVRRIAAARPEAVRPRIEDAGDRLIERGADVCADALTLIQVAIVAVSPSRADAAAKGQAHNEWQATLRFLEIVDVADELGVDLRARHAATRIAHELDRRWAAAGKPGAPPPHLNTIRNLMRKNLTRR
jgi:hypothetical protein